MAEHGGWVCGVGCGVGVWGGGWGGGSSGWQNAGKKKNFQLELGGWVKLRERKLSAEKKKIAWNWVVNFGTGHF